MLYTAFVTDHLTFQEKMTFTHVLCKIVVAQNINDKSGHYTFWKCHIEGAAWKKPLFRGAPRIQRMTFYKEFGQKLTKIKKEDSRLCPLRKSYIKGDVRE